MTLYLTNTMTRPKMAFTPANPDHVTMYVCGPTIYNFARIGDARPAVVFDVTAEDRADDSGWRRTG